MHLINSLYMSSSTIQIIGNRVSISWPWYIVRASGFTAAGLLILIMLSGIGQVTGLTYRLIDPIKAWAIHKALSYALLAAIIIHGGFLFIDHFVSFSFIQLFIPFLNRYSNKSLVLGLNLNFMAIASGILAMYCIVIIIATSLKWIDTKKRIWKNTHYLSYIVFILVFIHALSSGSDLKYGTFRLAFIASGLLVLLGIASRLYRAGLMKD